MCTDATALASAEPPGAGMTRALGGPWKGISARLLSEDEDAWLPFRLRPCGPWLPPPLLHEQPRGPPAAPACVAPDSSHHKHTPPLLLLPLLPLPAELALPPVTSGVFSKKAGGIGGGPASLFKTSATAGWMKKGPLPAAPRRASSSSSSSSSSIATLVLCESLGCSSSSIVNDDTECSWPLLEPDKLELDPEPPGKDPCLSNALLDRELPSKPGGSPGIAEEPAGGAVANAEWGTLKPFVAVEG